MYVKGEVLQGTITLGFTVSGEKNNWTVRIIAPGGVTTEGETCERTWHVLFNEMLSDAYEAARNRRHPERAPMGAGR